MKNIFKLLVLFLLVSTSFAGGLIPKGNVGETLPAIDRIVFGPTRLAGMYQGVVDPTGVGTFGNAGAIFQNTLNGKHFVKLDNGVSTNWYDIQSKIGAIETLSDGHMYVGNAGDVATEVLMSSEATMDNIGAVTLDNDSVTGKVLTGFTSGAGVLAATDTILDGIQKLDGNDKSLTDANIRIGSGLDVAEQHVLSGEATMVNTGAVTLDNDSVIGKVLTGWTSGAGAVAATDSILEGLQKIDGNVTDGLADTAITGKLLTGFVSGAGTVAATDTILEGIEKLDGNAIAHIADTTTHGTTGDIVGTSDTQILTNKTIDGNSNTLTVLAATQLSGATPIANGGSGQVTQQAAIDALTNVSAASTSQVLTKNVTGNATFQTIAGRTSKNEVINGDLMINQRQDLVLNAAATSVVDQKYYVDMFKAATSITATQQYLSTSQPSALSRSRSIKIIASGTNPSAWMGYSYYVNPADNNKFIGKTITLSAYVKSNIAASIRIQEAGVSVSSTGHSGGGGWERLTATVTIGSTCSGLFMWITNSAVATVAGNYVEFTGVKLEIAGSVTPFVETIFEEELLKSLPYYEKSYAYATKPGTASQWTNIQVTSIEGSVPNNYPFDTIRYAKKIKTPTYFHVSSYAGTIDVVSTAATGADVANTGYLNVGMKSAILKNTQGTTVPMTSISYHWVCAAEI